MQIKAAQSLSCLPLCLMAENATVRNEQGHDRLPAHTNQPSLKAFILYLP